MSGQLQEYLDKRALRKRKTFCCLFVGLFTICLGAPAQTGAQAKTGMSEQMDVSAQMVVSEQMDVSEQMVASAVNVQPYSKEDISSNPLKYRNPVVSRNVPDPTVIQVGDSGFYVYATGQNVSIYHSQDLVNWTFTGTAFTNENRPALVPNAGIWAPDINCIDGKYVLYYSMSVWGGETTASIGFFITRSDFTAYAKNGDNSFPTFLTIFTEAPESNKVL
jgi:hypothetical protein